MKLKVILGLLLLTAFMTSCYDSAKTIKIQFQEVNGLKEQSPVFLHGVIIGEVKSIEIDNDVIIVKVTVKKDIKLPVDSDFRIVELNMLGTKAIEINLGTNPVLLENDEIVEGTIKEPNFDIENIDKVMENFLNPYSKLDSIVIELKRLNRNIEKLIEGQK